MQGISDVKLLDAEVSTVECSDTTVLCAALRTLLYSLHLPEDVVFDDKIVPYKAVVCQSSKLANIGQYIKCDNEVNQ